MSLTPPKLHKKHDYGHKPKSLRIEQQKNTRNITLPVITFSNFWKESALRGIHPWMASAATAVSQGGHPTAFCSATTFLWTNPSLKLKAPLLLFELFFLNLLFLSFSELVLESKIINPEWPLVEEWIASEISTIVGDGE